MHTWETNKKNTHKPLLCWWSLARWMATRMVRSFARMISNEWHNIQQYQFLLIYVVTQSFHGYRVAPSSQGHMVASVGPGAWKELRCLCSKPLCPIPLSPSAAALTTTSHAAIPWVMCVPVCSDRWSWAFFSVIQEVRASPPPSQLALFMVIFVCKLQMHNKRTYSADLEPPGPLLGALCTQHSSCPGTAVTMVTAGSWHQRELDSSTVYPKLQGCLRPSSSRFPGELGVWLP